MRGSRKRDKMMKMFDGTSAATSSYKSSKRAAGEMKINLTGALEKVQKHLEE
jgi:uncharacterized protein YdeI (BOF family)